jgi:hypothetical protein
VARLASERPALADDVACKVAEVQIKQAGQTETVILIKQGFERMEARVDRVKANLPAKQ